nr:class I SAM-dependent methyltransferase [Auraticoccus cholistanensis]
MHFEAQADRYDRARPPYPPELWQRLHDLGLLRPGARALDLGAGTGQATGPLLEAGLRVTAVEPGERLATRLRAAFPAAEVLLGRAEDVQLPADAFDLVVAATSIHWMDLDVLLPAVHRWLAPGGRFLVWRNVFGDPDVSTPFRDRVADVVRARRSPARPGPDPQDVAATRERLTRGGHFTVDETTTYRWSVELDEEQVHALFSTFSDWSADEVDRVAGAVGDLGGRVVEHYRSWLLVLTPTPQA